MATSFPSAIDSFGFTADSGDGVAFDVFQRLMDAIVAIETLLGAGAAAGTSFSPTIVSSGGGVPTYSKQVGRYRRFLGLVHVTGRVTLATFASLAAGQVSIGGLPVASANVTDLYGTGTIPFWNALTTAVVNVTGYVAPNTSVIALNIVTVAATGVTSMTKADLTGTSDLIFSAIYPST